MKQRCNNPKHTAAKWYHDKGIRVCDEWEKSFEAFQIWAMENGYFDKGSIDRIDPNKGYDPTNCRWITLSENRRRVTRNYGNERKIKSNNRCRKPRSNTVDLCGGVRTCSTKIDFVVENAFAQAKMILSTIIAGANEFISKSDEDTLLAITAGYLAGKEAGRREAQAQAQTTEE
jgi:hypothetical protein